MNRIREILQELETYVDAAEQKLEIAGVRPKYALGQKVWIFKGDVPSWYTFAIYSEDAKIEDMFEEEEIETMVISRLRDSHTRGCGATHNNPVVVVYTFNRYYQHENRLLEKNVYLSLHDAVQANQEQFDKELTKFKEEQARRKADEKRQLQQKLAELS